MRARGNLTLAAAKRQTKEERRYARAQRQRAVKYKRGRRV